MNITYEKNVAHCEPSPYVKVVTISSAEPAANADRLDLVTFEETGRFALTKRGQYKPGDKVMFIPAESILPFELSELLGVTGYLSKGRVKVTKLRGNRSEGLVVDADLARPYLPYIVKWEDPPTIHMKGNPMRRTDVPPEFEKFYKMPNLLDEPKLFHPGEWLFWSIKIHGTNCRFGYLQNPETEEWELYVGSHNVVLKPDDENLYWKVTKETLSNAGLYPHNLHLIKDMVFYGEIYGPGIQDGFHYDEVSPTMKIFSMKVGYDYVDVGTLRGVCNKVGIPVVDHNKIPFRALSNLRDIADNAEGLTTSHINEGIVVVSAERPDVMAKLISFNYLLLKNRTERH